MNPEQQRREEMQQRRPSLMVTLWHHRQRPQTKRQLQSQQQKKRQRPDRIILSCRVRFSFYIWSNAGVVHSLYGLAEHTAVVDVI